MKTIHSLCTIALLLLLTACGATPEPTVTPVDIGAIQTSAVATTIAGVTQTAAAYTPTPEATPTITETPTLAVTETPAITATPTVNICDEMVFVSDSTVPDESVMAPGQEFVKTWKVRNAGSCTWSTGYTIVYGGYSDRMSGQTTPLTTDVPPSTEAEISMALKAPSTPGRYVSAWRLVNNNGYTFGTPLIVIIIVQ